MTKESIAESCRSWVEQSARFRDVQRFGTCSGVIGSQSSEETIWFIRSESGDFSSVSDFFVNAFIISEDGDWGVIEDELLDWKCLTPIGRRSALEAISRHQVSLKLEIEQPEELVACHLLRERWNDWILICEGQSGFCFIRWSSTA